MPTLTTHCNQPTRVQAHMYMVDKKHYDAEDDSEAGMHCDQALPVHAEVHIVDKGECSARDELGLPQVLQCLCAQAEEVNSCRCHCQCMHFSSLLLLLTRPRQSVPQTCLLLGTDWISHRLSVLLKPSSSYRQILLSRQRSQRRSSVNSQDLHSCKISVWGSIWQVLVQAPLDSYQQSCAHAATT